MLCWIRALHTGVLRPVCCSRPMLNNAPLIDICCVQVVLKKPQMPKLQLDVAEWSSPLKSTGVFADSPNTDGTLVTSKKYVF
jgi:hypothetical protein